MDRPLSFGFGYNIYIYIGYICNDNSYHSMMTGGYISHFILDIWLHDDTQSLTPRTIR